LAFFSPLWNLVINFDFHLRVISRSLKEKKLKKKSERAHLSDPFDFVQIKSKKLVLNSQYWSCIISHILAPLNC
jgi:hypothetical protein